MGKLYWLYKRGGIKLEGLDWKQGSEIEYNLLNGIDINQKIV